MPNPPPILNNGSSTQSPDLQNSEQYPTLKQSLSASLANGFHDATRQLDGYFGVGKGRPQPSKPTRSSSPGAVDVSTPQSPAETALSALRYLPVPLLVLSGMMTVVLANEAIGRVFGLAGHSSGGFAEDGERDVCAGDILLGKSINQLGIDMIQDGQRIWVGWERFLDNLAQEMDRGAAEQLKSQEKHSASEQNGENVSAGTPDSGMSDPMSRRKKMIRASTVDTVVDVVLPAEFGSMPAEFSTRSQKQVRARLIISIWTLKGEKHFTLSFTNVSHSSMPTTDEDLRPESLSPTSAPLSPSSNAIPTSSNGPHNSTKGPSCVEFPSGKLLTLIPFSPLSSPTVAEVAGTPSVLQKTTRMKDAILNTMEIPVCAMWKDQSLAFPNKAAMRVLHTCTDPVTEDAYNLLSGFKCWTEDFSRELNEDEYPLVELCRSQKPFKSWRIGVKDQKRGNTVYDCSGECYYDEKNGEFLAGIIALKDVTEYTSALKSQSEVNEQQFELICHTTPNMVSSVPASFSLSNLTYSRQAVDHRSHW